MDPAVRIALQNVHSLPEVFFPPVSELLTFARVVLELYLQSDSENKHAVIATNFINIYEVIQALEKVATSIRLLRSQLGI